MPKITVTNKTNRTLGFHLPTGGLVELGPKKHVNNIDLTAEQLLAIKSASDLTFSVDGESEVDKAAQSELSERLTAELVKANEANEALRKQLSDSDATVEAAKRSLEHQEGVIESLNAELVKIKEAHDLLALEVDELKTPKQDTKGKK